MQDDDLRTPLKPRSRLQRLWDRRPTPSRAAIGLSVLALAGLALWAVMTPYPKELEEVASAPIAPVDKVATGSTAPAKEQTRIVPGAKAKKPVPEEKEFEVITPVDPNVPSASSLPRSPQEARRRKVAMLGMPLDKPLPRAPLRAVSERVNGGVLPRVSSKGLKPWRAYAKSMPRRILASPKPKIAIVIGGLGLNAELTRRAVMELPGVITLAYAPYAKGLQRRINAARHAGHEVMLQLPMEPWGYPAVNPGPKTLLVSASSGRNVSNLRWLMSRAAGYAGVVNYAGERFLTSGEALAPVLHEIRKRGLIFLDSGETSRSLLPSLAQVIGLPALSASLRLDKSTEEIAIRNQLHRLVARAKEKGYAIGVGSAFPVTLRVLEDWLAGRKGREETVIVPVTALYRLHRKG